MIRRSRCLRRISCATPQPPSQIAISLPRGFAMTARPRRCRSRAMRSVAARVAWPILRTASDRSHLTGVSTTSYPSTSRAVRTSSMSCASCEIKCPRRAHTSTVDASRRAAVPAPADRAAPRRGAAQRSAIEPGRHRSASLHSSCPSKACGRHGRRSPQGQRRIGPSGSHRSLRRRRDMARRATASPRFRWAQPKAWSLSPLRLRCSSRASASSRLAGARRHPPHHEMHLAQHLEPFGLGGRRTACGSCPRRSAPGSAHPPRPSGWRQTADPRRSRVLGVSRSPARPTLPSSTQTPASVLPSPLTRSRFAMNSATRGSSVRRQQTADIQLGKVMPRGLHQNTATTASDRQRDHAAAQPTRRSRPHRLVLRADMHHRHRDPRHEKDRRQQVDPERRGPGQDRRQRRRDERRPRSRSRS